MVVDVNLMVMVMMPLLLVIMMVMLTMMVMVMVMLTVRANGWIRLMLGAEPASSVLHCPRSIMEFKQTRGQDGFCGRYQGSNASKRAKRLTMSLAPTLPTPYTPSYAHCPPFVLLYTQVHKDVTVS